MERCPPAPHPQVVQGSRRGQIMIGRGVFFGFFWRRGICRSSPYLPTRAQAADIEAETAGNG